MHTRPTYRYIGLAVLLISALATVYVRVLSQPRVYVLVDLVVYREGAQSLGMGRPLYDHMTLQNNLPFTYPPLSAWLAFPFGMVPFPVAAALWTILQVWAVYGAAHLAMRVPMVAVRQRLGAKADGVPYLAAAAMLWMEPLHDGVYFGQVNAFIVVAAMADLSLRHMRWPRGALTGLVTAVKLTPGVFWIHYAVSGQWRLLVNSIATAAGLTILVAVADLRTSLDFWFGAIRQPERLGENVNTSNQSIRGMLMRLGETHNIPEFYISAAWLVCVVLVAVPSFLLAKRFHDLGDRAAEVGVVGLMAVLLSPVAWIHHLHWLVVLLPAVIGDGRRRRRWIIAAAYLGLFMWRMPWTGHGMLLYQDLPPAGNAVAMVLQDGFGLLALLLLVILWRLSYDGHHQGVVQVPGVRPRLEASQRPAGSSPSLPRDSSDTH